MRKILLTTLAALSVFAIVTAPAQDAKPDAELKKKIADLIAKLGGDDLQAREDAKRELRKIDKPAVTALAEAKNNSTSEAVRVSAGEILKYRDIRKIRAKLDSIKIRESSYQNAQIEGLIYDAVLGWPMDEERRTGAVLDKPRAPTKLWINLVIPNRMSREWLPSFRIKDASALEALKKIAELTHTTLGFEPNTIIFTDKPEGDKK